MARRVRFFVLNDPQTAVINRSLAQEIGLIESVLLMHLEFLISISENEREGRFWTYQSLANLHETYFPYWSKATLGRAMQKLVELELVIVGNYNKSKIDRTPWYALNPEGLSRLRSLRVESDDSGHETPSSQNETSPQIETPTTSQSETSAPHGETRTSHHETAIPEITSETTQRETFPIPELGISSSQFWHALLDTVESRGTFPRRDIDTWLRTAHLAGRDGDALLIAAPNKAARDRLDARMLPQLRAVAAERFGTPVALRVVVQ